MSWIDKNNYQKKLYTLLAKNSINMQNKIIINQIYFINNINITILNYNTINTHNNIKKIIIRIIYQYVLDINN